jgi:hypothetical protein
MCHPNHHDNDVYDPMTRIPFKIPADEHCFRAKQTPPIAVR